MSPDYFAHGKDILEPRYQQQQEKFGEGARELARVPHEPVRVTGRSA
jgi:hypothetical protein